MNNTIMKPGTIVLARYNKINGYGDRDKGYFCVLYDQQLDSADGLKNNITALKISTSFSMAEGSYCCPINLKTNNFFEKECMVLCDKLYTLSKENVLTVLGTLDSGAFLNTTKTHHRWEREKNRQMEDCYHQ